MTASARVSDIDSFDSFMLEEGSGEGSFDGEAFRTGEGTFTGDGSLALLALRLTWLALWST